MVPVESSKIGAVQPLEAEWFEAVKCTGDDNVYVARQEIHFSRAWSKSIKNSYGLRCLARSGPCLRYPPHMREIG